MTASPIRVLVVEDQPVLRAGFTAMLDAEPDLTVVGQAGDGATAVELGTALAPDVVLMDIRMPGMDGLTATRLLTDTHPDAPLPRQLETLTQGVDLAAPLEDIAQLLAPDGIFGKQFSDTTSIDQATAEQLLELTEQLIAYLVVLPGAMAQLKSRIATAPVPLRDLRGMPWLTLPVSRLVVE